MLCSTQSLWTHFDCACFRVYGRQKSRIPQVKHFSCRCQCMEWYTRFKSVTQPDSQPAQVFSKEKDQISKQNILLQLSFVLLYVIHSFKRSFVCISFLLSDGSNWTWSLRQQSNQNGPAWGQPQVRYHLYLVGRGGRRC